MEDKMDLAADRYPRLLDQRVGLGCNQTTIRLDRDRSNRDRVVRVI